MKLRHLLTEATLIVSLLAATAIAVLVAVPKGGFKIANSTTISGWAYNDSTPGNTLNVRIFTKDKSTGGEVSSQRMTAGEYSDGLYGSGEGSGYHTFTLNMDWSALPYGVYLVEGYVENSDFSNPRTCTSGNSNAKQEAPVAGAQDLVPLGVFKTMGYCPYETCSEDWGRHASADTVVTAGYTIAVDPRIVPYDSRVMINDIVHTAEDRGGAVRGNHIGIFFSTHTEICQHGTQNVKACLVQS